MRLSRPSSFACLMKTTPAGVTVQQITRADVAVANAGELRHHVGVGGTEGFVQDLKIAARRDLVHLADRALTKTAGIGESATLLDLLLLQVIGNPFQHVLVVDRALEHPMPLGNRRDDGERALAGDERDIGRLGHRRHRQGDAAHIAAADDELNLVLADQAAGRGNGLLRLTFRIVKCPGDRPAVDALAALISSTAS